MFGGLAERKFDILRTGTDERVGPSHYLVCDTGDTFCGKSIARRNSTNDSTLNGIKTFHFQKFAIKTPHF